MHTVSTVFVVLQSQPKPPNYWLPILAGAIMGIALAWWLRRRK
jgi:LPXTG-motif cell wall-anchored protein